MTKNKFHELYSQNKTRPFVLHLVRAYSPVSKIKKVWEETEDPSKMKCCCCKTPLISLEEIYTKTVKDEEVALRSFQYFMDCSLNPEIHKDDKREDSPLIKAIDGKLQAFTGEGTETMICLSCAKELILFTTDKLFSGDKQITFAINKEIIKDFPELKDSLIVDTANYKHSNQLVKKEKKQTATLGDFMDAKTKKALGLIE